MGLTVDADISNSEDLFGKTVNNLQSNVTVGSEGIGGTLKYIADYSSAYGPGEDSGNYLVLHAEVPNATGVTITAEVVDGVHGPTTLDESGINIFRITSNTQKVKFVAYKDGFEPVTRVFRLNGLNLVTA